MNANKGRIAERFAKLHTDRQAKVDRSRAIASLTIPHILPHVGFSETQGIYSPQSSMSARGCMFLASKMHAAMVPMNNLPFIDIKPKFGTKVSTNASNLLKDLTDQVHETLMSGNIREVFNEALLHLIIVGDVLLFIEDDINLRLYRLDQYVLLRDITGEVVELIVVDWDLIDRNELGNSSGESSALNPPEAGHKIGYVPVYTQIIRKKDKWLVNKEKKDKIIEEDKEYPLHACPYIPLRWNAIHGENYGRSHCEEIYGDILANEKYTEALHYGMVGASAFWMALAPSATVNEDQMATKPIGSWVRVDPTQAGVIAPARDLNPQITTMLDAVERSRETLSKAFLMTGEAIPQGDRVTAMAVKAIMIELEQVLGGNFSGLARDFFVPATRFILERMFEDGTIKEEWKSILTPSGSKEDPEIIKFDILTGLQAIGKETDNNKLLMFMETMRNLPPEMLERINYDTLLTQWVRSFGFPPNDWILDQETINERRENMLQAQAQADQALQAQKNAGQVAAAVAPTVADAMMQPQPQG